MKTRHLLAAVALMIAPSFPVTAQDDPRALAEMAGASVGPQGWQVPRTAWGDPDLRGTWPLDRVGRTTFERPVALGTKAYLTDEEYAAARAQAEAVAAGYDQEDQSNEIGSGHWFEWGTPLRQTSLIMAPANGQIGRAHV